jgi:phosphatidylglycerophosphate synthase
MVRASTTRSTPPFRDFVARRFAVKSPLVSWMLFERIGGALAYPLARLGTPPAVATLLGGATGIIGALLLATAGDGGDAVLAAVVLLLSYSLDCTDGQLARATLRTSDMGAWLDVAVDAVVIAFITVALCYALLAGGDPPVLALLLAGAYGGSRTVSLLTSSRVQSGSGGMRLTGVSSLLRTAYVAAIDTPIAYVALCACRVVPDALRAGIIILTVMTATQTVVSAHAYFTSASLRSADRQ